MAKQNNHVFKWLNKINTGSYPSRVMSVARLSTDEDGSEPKRARILTQPTLGFLDEDKARTIQPHDDALVVTLRIGGV